MAEPDPNEETNPPADENPEASESQPEEPIGEDASEEAAEAPEDSAEGESESEPEDPAEKAINDAQASVLSAVQDAINAVNSGEDTTAPQAAAAEAAEAAMMGGEALNMPDFAGSTPSGELPGGITLLGDVNLNVKVELGRTRMHVDDVLRLGDGSVVELDKLAGDPVDIYVNGRPVAKGEVLVLNDNFCVRVNEILAHTAAGELAKNA
ncbi:MAG: flagellar motor switch protein FliN [Planctomycetota bacterium]